MNQMNCPGCGGHTLIEGSLCSTGTVRFRPADTKFLTFATADICVTPWMCRDCGQIAMIGDCEKLGRVSNVSTTTTCNEKAAV